MMSPQEIDRAVLEIKRLRDNVLDNILALGQVAYPVFVEMKEAFIRVGAAVADCFINGLDENARAKLLREIRKAKRRELYLRRYRRRGERMKKR